MDTNSINVINRQELEESLDSNPSPRSGKSMRFGSRSSSTSSGKRTGGSLSGGSSSFISRSRASLRKQETLDKDREEKKEPGERFEGEGVLSKAKLIGVDPVSGPRGDKMCQNAMSRLKAIIKGTGAHKQRITLSISLEGIKLKDDKTGELISHHPIPLISYISRDTSDNRAFGFVYGSPDSGHQFIGIKTEKAAIPCMQTIADLFSYVYDKKKKEKDTVGENGVNDIVNNEAQSSDQKESHHLHHFGGRDNLDGPVKVKLVPRRSRAESPNFPLVPPPPPPRHESCGTSTRIAEEKEQIYFDLNNLQEVLTSAQMASSSANDRYATWESFTDLEQVNGNSPLPPPPSSSVSSAFGLKEKERSLSTLPFPPSSPPSVKLENRPVAKRASDIINFDSPRDSAFAPINSPSGASSHLPLAKKSETSDEVFFTPEPPLLPGSGRTVGNSFDGQSKGGNTSGSGQSNQDRYACFSEIHSMTSIFDLMATTSTSTNEFESSTEFTSPLNLSNNIPTNDVLMDTNSVKANGNPFEEASNSFPVSWSESPSTVGPSGGATPSGQPSPFLEGFSSSPASPSAPTKPSRMNGSQEEKPSPTQDPFEMPSVFADLDPLGREKPFLDFFQAEKNPHKKKLQGLETDSVSSLGSPQAGKREDPFSALGEGFAPIQGSTKVGPRVGSFTPDSTCSPLPRPSSSASVASRNPFLSDTASDSGDDGHFSLAAPPPLPASCPPASRCALPCSPRDSFVWPTASESEQTASFTTNDDVFAAAFNEKFTSPCLTERGPRNDPFWPVSSSSASTSPPFPAPQSRSTYSVRPRSDSRPKTASPRSTFSSQLPTTPSDSLPPVPPVGPPVAPPRPLPREPFAHGFYASTTLPPVPPPRPPARTELNTDSNVPPPPLPRRKVAPPTTCRSIYAPVAGRTLADDPPTSFAPPLPAPMRRTGSSTQRVNAPYTESRSDDTFEKADKGWGKSETQTEAEKMFSFKPFSDESDRDEVRVEPEYALFRAESTIKEEPFDPFNCAFVEKHLSRSGFAVGSIVNLSSPGKEEKEESIQMTSFGIPDENQLTSTPVSSCSGPETDPFSTRPHDLQLSTISNLGDTSTACTFFSEPSSSVFESTQTIDQTDVIQTVDAEQRKEPINQRPEPAQVPDPASEGTSTGPFNHFGDHVSPPERDIFRKKDDPFAGDDFFGPNFGD